MTSRILQPNLWRGLTFIFISFLFPSALAAEIVPVGVYSDGKEVELDWKHLGMQCSIVDTEKDRVIDCTYATDTALEGVIFQFDEKTGDMIFECIHGCRKNAFKMIKYVTLESGC